MNKRYALNPTWLEWKTAFNDAAKEKNWIGDKEALAIVKEKTGLTTAGAHNLIKRAKEGRASMNKFNQVFGDVE
jgi:hypothetical protein